MSVAITGGIACGKSLFAACLQRLGVEVLDADDVTHALEAPGGAAVGPIRRRFGEAVIAPDGGVDRVALAGVVFADTKAREDLNALLHPMVRQVIDGWREHPGATRRAAVIPLLFEVGWERDWDRIICVSSDTQAQIDRLMRFRGLSAEQARQRLEAQLPIAEKAARAHLTVHNNAGTEWLAEEAKRIYRLLYGEIRA
ncbi:MAG: dephospho-CoA kinase [Kiritimatiellaeota bacterium]|nr:dephospho-CoA kinase [Kiritimatiellota bacterium]